LPVSPRQDRELETDVLKFGMKQEIEACEPEAEDNRARPRHLKSAKMYSHFSVFIRLLITSETEVDN